MLPFFRKIRYKLAKDNQFIKYSRYAIGEIVLVVIGILIALQVNNWNEDKNIRKIEHKLLQELKADLAVFDEQLTAYEHAVEEYGTAAGMRLRRTDYLALRKERNRLRSQIAMLEGKTGICIHRG